MGEQARGIAGGLRGSGNGRLEQLSGSHGIVGLEGLEHHGLHGCRQCGPAGQGRSLSGARQGCRDTGCIGRSRFLERCDGCAELGERHVVDIHEAQLRIGADPGRKRVEALSDHVVVDLQLREGRIGGRREVEQEDEEQRPGHRLARVTHRRRREVAHEDVGQGGRTHHEAEDQAKEVQPVIGQEGGDMRLQRAAIRSQLRQPFGDHLGFARRDVGQCLAIHDLRKRNAILLGRQDDDRDEIGDDQHDVLRHLRPGHRPHAAQHRADQDAGEARIDRDLE